MISDILPGQALRIGLIGLGTVGCEVAERLLERRESLRRRAGIDLVLERVLVRDLGRERAVRIPAEMVTTDPAALVDDPAIDVVVELAGGEEPVRGYLERALRNRKHVVTANKLVMAKHGPELLELAGEMNVDLYFEAAVGGGIPLISTFKVDLLANDIQRIMAVINGTTNYVLGRMANQGLTLPLAVREAQAAGYAEADPSEDVEGFDAAYKLAIMASVGFGAHVHPDQVYREGIAGIEPVDFRYARELGYEVKLLAYAARDPETGGIEARTHPALVPHGHPLAGVEGAANAVYIEGDLVGQVLLQGQGAGGRPTASSVVGDIIDLARSVHRQVQNRGAFDFDPEVRVLPMERTRSRAYYRCRLADRPGVLARVSGVFGEEGVSIASAIQKESDELTAEFVVTTHPSPDGALQRARRRIGELDVVTAVNSFLRVL